MVGLDKFKEAFADFSDNYVIISGTACDIVMTGTVVRPRATHDIDMIVVVKNMTQEFVEKVREEGDTLMPSLAKSLDTEESVVMELLNQLNELFTLE